MFKSHDELQIKNVTRPKSSYQTSAAANRLRQSTQAQSNLNKMRMSEIQMNP